MSQHSPEPWRLISAEGEPVSPEESVDFDGVVTACDANGANLEADPYDGVGEADWRRIVACVNICKGIPTEELEAWAGSCDADIADLFAADLFAERAGLTLVDPHE
jgi:hypothetical protein